MQNVFPRLSATPGAVRSAGPSLGQHNQEVFAGLLGLGSNEIDELAAARII
jgi:formyl-CoA transferase